MRYHYDDSVSLKQTYGGTYVCDHPVYDTCTLYLIGDKGLAVIQQHRFKNTKLTYWGSIDKSVIDPIYLHPKFKDFFDAHAKKEDEYGLYPTVTVRQIMWALRMKPLKKERWETVFDHKDI